MTILWVALQVYDGKMRGFAQVPATDERRKEALRGFLKKLIWDTLLAGLKGREKEPSKTGAATDPSADK